MMDEKEKLILTMYLSNRRKKIIIITCIVVFVVLLAIGITSYLLFNSFKLDNDTVTIEYGEEYTPIISDFVKTNNQINDENTFLNCYFKYEENKDYIAVGEYDVKVTHIKTFNIGDRKLFNKTFTKDAKVIVKDTNPPVFSSDCPSELNLQSTNMNVVDYFSATDLSGISNIYLKGDGTDYSVAGKYTVTVVAMDNNGNKTEKQCIVNLTVPLLTVAKTDFNLKVNDTAQIEAQYEGFDVPKYKSSDDTMASVTTSGEIKALRAGTCVITVFCNGLKVDCNITITENEDVISASTSKRESTSSQNNSSTNNSKKSSSNNSSGGKTSSNYPEKEFLFKDGYTMDNVTDAAYAYLKASGKSGRCVPIKNSEGIYLGMRVEFD